MRMTEEIVNKVEADRVRLFAAIVMGDMRISNIYGHLNESNSCLSGRSLSPVS